MLQTETVEDRIEAIDHMPGDGDIDAESTGRVEAWEDAAVDWDAVDCLRNVALSPLCRRAPVVVGV